MDLTQRKLSKSEWESIEKPVSSQEKEILQMLKEGFNNVDIKTNKHQSLFSFVKIDKNDGTELLLFQKYFEPLLKEIIKKSVSYTHLTLPTKRIV